MFSTGAVCTYVCVCVCACVCACAFGKIKLLTWVKIRHNEARHRCMLYVTVTDVHTITL